MDDLISRQAAIDVVAELASSMSVCMSLDECHGMKRMQGMVVRALDELPSAQRTGEWIHDGSDWTNRWICSRCGYKWVFDKANYCPACGAKMKNNGDD